MSTTSGGPNLVTNGLVLHLDAANIKSYKGVPTTNLLANGSLSIYNNVPAHVTATLTQTTDTYRGVPIWKETLTPTTATGVSYLTGGNNPGIGVVSSSGGGTANRYTGFSIFFKPTVQMHTNPIFTNYSNISGWQSCCNYDDMGDGWFRAHVIWYDTVTRSDGKYWAINPLSAVLNTPIDIYWAGPFKEDRNDSVFVSQFVNGTRGTTVATGGGWADISRNSNHGELVNGTTYNVGDGGNIVLDGVNDYIYINHNGNLSFSSGNFTISIWNKDISNPISLYGGIITNDESSDNAWKIFKDVNENYYKARARSTIVNFPSYTVGRWHFYTFTFLDGLVTTYFDGIATGNFSSGALNPISQNNIAFGSYRYNDAVASQYLHNQSIGPTLLYNRALSAQEILQNYNSTKSRFGLP